MKILNISLLALSLVAGACSSDDDNNDSCSVLGPCYTAGSGITEDGSGVSGTGTVDFGEIADSADSARNFKFTVSLEEGSSVTLNAFAQDDLANGANIVFTRTGSTVTFNGGEGAKTLLNANLTNADANAAMTINVDVHNNEEGEAHVIAWAGNTDPEEDSEDLENHATKGVGVYAGLTLSNATVTSFSHGVAKIVHK